MNAAADALLRLEHEHAKADGFERQRRVQAGEPGADDDDVAVRARPTRSASLEPGVVDAAERRLQAARAGPAGSSRARSGRGSGRAQPSARRGASGVSRSTMSSRTIAT